VNIAAVDVRLMWEDRPPAGGKDILAVAKLGDKNAHRGDDPDQADQDQRAVNHHAGNDFLLFEAAGFYGSH
jgi:hypothetical protein